MNILISAKYTAPKSGSFIASCVRLGRHLRANGDDVMFIFPENEHNVAENSWVDWLKREDFCVYFADNGMSELQEILFLKNIISKHKIDILHIHFGMLHHAAVYHRKELNVKLLVHDHMDFVDTESYIKQKVENALRSAVYRKNSVAVASVNPQKNSTYIFARHWFVPNGLPFERNIEKTASKEEVRTCLGVAPNEKICLFLGWDLHRKGLDIAVKAVNELRKTAPEVILGVVGTDGHFGKVCERFIFEATGIDPHSSWIKYLPSTEDMFAYYRAAEVFLSASRAEAFSYGILEAVSQNIPVVVSDIKGTSWCHRYTKTVVYATEDYKACANAISSAISLGRRESNAEAIVRDYSIEKWCNRITEVYKSL